MTDHPETCKKCGKAWGWCVCPARLVFEDEYAALIECRRLLKEARPWICWCRDMIRATDDPNMVKDDANRLLAEIDAATAPTAPDSTP